MKTNALSRNLRIITALVAKDFTDLLKNRGLRLHAKYYISHLEPYAEQVSSPMT